MSAQGVDERMINVHYYYYYLIIFLFVVLFFVLVCFSTSFYLAGNSSHRTRVRRPEFPARDTEECRVLLRNSGGRIAKQADNMGFVTVWAVNIEYATNLLDESQQVVRLRCISP